MYPSVVFGIFWWLFVPYVVLFALYIEFSHYEILDYFNYMSGREDHPTIEVKIMVLTVSIFILSCYFLYQEASLLVSDPKDYLSRIWSYFDFLPQVLNIVMMVVFWYDYAILDKTVEGTWLVSLCTFFMWAKFLNFLRLSSNYSHFLRMLARVIHDMQYFLIVFALVCLAFADTFYILAKASNAIDPSSGKFVNELKITSWSSAILYVYNMTLGDFSTDDLSETEFTGLAYTLFVVCTIFNMIIMLNLLIAVISETFGEVNEHAR